MTSLAHDVYHVGIVCALKIELAAMRAMLDEEHGRVDAQDSKDHNVYFAGRIHKHNVVIACLPAGVDGTAAAATVAKDMVRTFSQLRFGLLVGIGGGIPNLEHGIDIRLGDVVVSQPHGIHGGVIQYDKGKRKSDSVWERKGSLNAPPAFLLTALQSLQAEHELNGSQIPAYLAQMAVDRPKMVEVGYIYPGRDRDVFDSSESLTEIGSRKRKRGVRDERPNTDPVIHYGTIASGNMVVKDPSLRDYLRDECGALCVEMEAAGLMNEFPCLVVRGVSDYANEHKDDTWQRYAATTAASFAKELLTHVSTKQIIANHAMQQVLDTIKTESKTTVEYFRNQEEQRLHLKCHQALCTSTYAEYKGLNRRAVSGTCQWVLRHPKYLEWYQSLHDTLLWISADPGCGKSVLSRYLIEEVLCASGDLEAARYHPHTVCYFFFKDNSNQDGLSIALSAVLHQLFLQQSELIRYAIPAYKAGGYQLSGEIGELWTILQNAARDTNAKPIVCVFDGLDECRVGDRKRLIDYLSGFYDARARGPSDAIGSLKFLVTSRPYDDIQDAFGHVPSDLPSIRLRGEDENDQIHDEIDLVIEDSMGDLARELNLSLENTERIKRKLFEMENRTYLWLYLVIDHIRSTFRRSLRPEREQIILLPRSVDEAYEQLLMRIEAESAGDQVRVILSIILGSRRALSVQEMALALDIAIDSSNSSSTFSSLAQFTVDPERLRDNIRQWCGLFIFINHGFIYLLHQTAKEFLLRYSAKEVALPWRWKQCIHNLEAEKLMATICVVFLNVREFDSSLLNGWMSHRDIGEPNSKHHGATDREAGSRYERLVASKALGVGEGFMESVINFFGYAAKHWASHVRLAEEGLDADVMRQSFKLYDCASLRFRRINHIASTHNFEGDDYKSHSIILAAFNGHRPALDHLLDFSPQLLDTVDIILGKTALIVAAEEGHAGATQALLDRGADVKVQFSHGNSALSVASERGHHVIVQILLTRQPEADFDLGGAFLQALRQGHTSIVTLILDAGMDLNAQLDGWGLPVNPQESAKDGISMTALKKAGVSLNGRHGWGTALHMAVWKCDEFLVTELIKRGADYNAQCVRSGSVLRTACLLRSEEIIRILWGKRAGVDPSSGTFTDKDAFRTAATYCSLEVVQKFIDRKVDVNEEDACGQTALQAASAGGNEEIVTLLLGHGAHLDAQSGTYGTALFAASERGHAKIVSILLTAGADFTPECGSRGTALHGAAAKGHDHVVRLLIHARLEVETPGGRHLTALQAGSFHGHERVVKLLLAEGAEVNATGGDYFTALHAASYQGHAGVVEILLTAGADASMQVPFFGSAFDVALAEGYEHVAALIMNTNLDMGDLFTDADNRGYRESFEAISRIARSARRDDVEDWLNEIIGDLVEDSDDDYRLSDVTSDNGEDQKGWFAYNYYWKYLEEDWGADRSGWSEQYEYYSYGYEQPSPPSDIRSHVVMPDDFFYEDINPQFPRPERGSSDSEALLESMVEHLPPLRDPDSDLPAADEIAHQEVSSVSAVDRFDSEDTVA